MELAQRESWSRETVTRSPVPIRVYVTDLWSFIPYYVARLCVGLREEGVDARLDSVRFHLDRNYFRAAGLAPDSRLFDIGGEIRYRFLRRIAKSLEYLLNLCVLGFEVPRSETTILHVQYFPFLNHGLSVELWFLEWIRYRRARIVYTVHNITDQDAPTRHKQLYRRAYSLADLLICHGKDACEELVGSFGIPREKIRVIPHGPLFEQRPATSPEEARTKLALPLGETIVLCFGAIRQYKGIQFLLDAWKRVIESGGRGKLIIAGTGDPRLLSSIRGRVSDNGLTSTVDLWLHYIPVDQLPLLHQAADVLVYPYKAGTTSGALLTGLNYGKAVVATNLPFFREYLCNNKNALLVDYGDLDALASSLHILLGMPEERFRIANTLRIENVHRITWREIAQATVDCYEELLEREHSRTSTPSQ